jgi:hypothetical protein
VVVGLPLGFLDREGLGMTIRGERMHGGCRHEVRPYRKGAWEGSYWKRMGIAVK